MLIGKPQKTNPRDVGWTLWGVLGGVWGAITAKLGDNLPVKSKPHLPDVAVNL